MARMFLAATLLVCLAAGGWPGLLAQATATAHPLDGPLLLTLQGRGVQVYRCALIAGTPAWVLDHPEADLTDADGKVVGHHAAGPSWQLDDGSMVVGALIEKTASSESGDVPSLWLSATTHRGAGLLASVATIRRRRAHGGVAPSQGCDTGMDGATVRVPYTATYTFYGPR